MPAVSKKQKTELKMMFVEGKWLYNYLVNNIYENQDFDLFKFNPLSMKTVIHKDKDKNDIESEFRYLPSSVKQTIVKQVVSSLKTLKTLRTKGFQKHGRLNFISELTSINLKQYGVTHEIRSSTKMKLQGISKLVKVSGIQQIKNIKGIDFANANILNTPNGYYVAITCYEDKNFKKKTNTVLFIARTLIDQKRPDRMIDAWKTIYRKFPDWNLLMIGDGNDKEKIMQYAKKQHVGNIQFIGNAKLDNYYKKAEILCMTSSFEGFGLVLTEALQNGIIPIAFDSYNAVHDIIDDGLTGMLIKPFSIESYAKHLSILMSDTSLRDTMRENIRNKDLSSFSEENVYNKWIILFNQLYRT